jgi:tetratricopeptide (TPR) repeat protein
MSTIISLIFIGLALVVALFIIIRKFPILAILDVNNIPGEKEAKFKEQIIKQRVERDVARWSGFFGRVWLFLRRRLSNLLGIWHGRLKKAKTAHKLSSGWAWPKRREKIEELLAAAAELMEKEDFNQAEEKLVEAISLDQKNLPAFFALGELYETRKKWSEARQTYEYSLKLARQKIKDGEEVEEITPQEILFCLANMEKDAGEAEAAMENIRTALDFEPNNPRYLDLILDLSIIRKDKDLARECLEKLRAVNPENQKLGEREDEVERMEATPL